MSPGHVQGLGYRRTNGVVGIPFKKAIMLNCGVAIDHWAFVPYV